MRYELSSRIRTDLPFRDVMITALGQFRKISSHAQAEDNERIVATDVEATFGSAHRSTKVIVTAMEQPDGWLLIADVNYGPSWFFWLFIILGLFTAFLWIIPVAFYLTQKTSVRDAIERCLSRVRDEMERQPAAPAAAPGRIDVFAELERLASLKERGIIDETEFADQKRKILQA